MSVKGLSSVQYEELKGHIKVSLRGPSNEVPSLTEVTGWNIEKVRGLDTEVVLQV